MAGGILIWGAIVSILVHAAISPKRFVGRSRQRTVVIVRLVVSVLLTGVSLTVLRKFAGPCFPGGTLFEDLRMLLFYSLYALPSAFGAAILFVRIDRRLRSPRGRCGNCEYDLTGNVSGVCPECGRTIPPSDREQAGT